MLAHEDNADERPAILQRLVDRHPQCGAIQRLYGLWRLEELDFDAALFHLTQAVQLGEVDEAVALALDEATEYREVCRQAERPGLPPTLRVSADEQLRGEMRPSAANWRSSCSGNTARC